MKSKIILCISFSIIAFIIIIQILFGQEVKQINFTPNRTQISFISNFTNQKSNFKTNKIKYQYLEKHTFLLKCKNEKLKKWTQNLSETSTNYEDPAEKYTHKMRITRGVIVYFPYDKRKNFLPEFKWLYRSWVEIQKREPKKWRTDLIVFTEKTFQTFKNLNCTFNNRRKSSLDKPMCTLHHYIPLKKRNLAQLKNVNLLNYEYLLDRLNMFSNDKNELKPFYRSIKDAIQNYSYTDSILIAFDGYNYFQRANYDFLIRTDLDVFLAPLFSTWLPKHCNDFNVGRAGYSENFNRNRLRKAALYLGLKNAGKSNLGSTWYSTPDQFRLVSYLTLINMVYLTREEFSKPEIDGAIGIKMWPYWHYGVLLLYGQQICLNHLIGSNQLNVVNLNKILDYPSSNPEPVDSKIHIHVYHTDVVFSKFNFKKGNYDNLTLPADSRSLKQVNFYCLRIALESKRLNSGSLNKMLAKEVNKKD